MALVYSHIRLDTNEIFYIGISNSNKYKRASSKKRNKFWKYITNKTDYKVDILYDNLNYEEACKKEIELIRLYGRRDLGTGSLCNLTDGGEGNIKRVMSDENKLKLSLKYKGIGFMTGRKHTLLTRLKMSKNNAHNSKKDNVKLLISDSKKKLIFDATNGIFYKGAKEVEECLGYKQTTVRSWLNGNNKNKSNLIYV